MEKETVADEILEETEQEAAEDMSQEQTDAQAAENQPDDKDVQTDDKKVRSARMVLDACSGKEV